MKQVILETIESIVGCSLVQVKPGVYSFVGKDGSDKVFRLSVMERCGGVDAKYYLWSLNPSEIPFVVAGNGAKAAARRVRLMKGSGPIFEIEEFLEFLFKEFI